MRDGSERRRVGVGFLIFKFQMNDFAEGAPFFFVFGSIGPLESCMCQRSYSLPLKVIFRKPMKMPRWCGYSPGCRPLVIGCFPSASKMVGRSYMSILRSGLEVS